MRGAGTAPPLFVPTTDRGWFEFNDGGVEFEPALPVTLPGDVDDDEDDFGGNDGRKAVEACASSCCREGVAETPVCLLLIFYDDSSLWLASSLLPISLSSLYLSDLPMLLALEPFEL